MNTDKIISLLIPSTIDTIYMVILSTFITVVFGLMLGIVLVVTKKKGVCENILVNKVLSYLVDTIRAVPYFILMLFLLPVTKFFIGTKIGTNASIFSLTLAAIPFFARLSESALLEVDNGVIEASKAMGASSKEIIFKVMLPEAFSQIVRAITTLAINLVGYSAMAGAIGGGGLGDLAVRYGFHRYEMKVMILTVVVLIVIVFIIQNLGNYIYNKLERKYKR